MVIDARHSFAPKQEPLPGMPEAFDILEWEIREVDGAAGTFMDEIVSAQSVDRLLEIAEQAQKFMEMWAYLNLSALDRATRMNKERGN
jgi:hypothetical protein